MNEHQSAGTAASSAIDAIALLLIALAIGGRQWFIGAAKKARWMRARVRSRVLTPNQ